MPRRSSLAIGVAVSAAVAIFAAGCSHTQPSAQPTDLTVSIDGEQFALVDGVAQNDGPPGSAGKNTVRVIGEPVPGDLNGDGRGDSALLVANDSGGSGTFYYAVVAVADGAGGYRATNVVPLGDRIAPQRIGFVDGRFVYEYLTRRPGEPLTVTPAVPSSAVIDFDQQSGQIGVRR